MFDINAIVNTAIATAVQEAIKPLVERIAVLEKQLNEDFANLVEQEVLANFACSDVIGYDEFNKVKERITALENNPAQGVDTTQARLITADAFVNHLDQQEWFWEKVSRFATAAQQRELDDEIMGIKQRVTALEDYKDENVLTSDDVEAIVERALTDHCDTYNHDDYDRAVSAVDDIDFDDLITNDNIDDVINEKLNGATVSISV